MKREFFCMRPANICLALTFSISAIAQIMQNRPELCGRDAAEISVPPEISAVSNDAYTEFSVKTATGTTKIEVPGVVQIEQVCRGLGSRLIVFGSPGPAVSDIFLIDSKTGAMGDTIRAFSPSVSPDGRWLATRAFSPPQSEITVSQEYLLYDLTKSAKENTVAGVDARYISARGRVLYPRLLGDAPYEHMGLPENQLHDFRSDSFYWSGDSKSLVFADNLNGELSAVLVKIDTKGQINTLTRRIVTSEICTEKQPTDPTHSFVLSAARIPGEESMPIQLEFRTLDDFCVPKIVSLDRKEFTPPPPEKAPVPPARAPAIPAEDLGNAKKQ